MTLENHLFVKDHHLHIGDYDTIELARDHHTPLYVTNENVIKERYRELYSTIERIYSPLKIHYAVKANSNISILKILLKAGAGVDTVSVGEVFSALNAGFPKEKILFTGNNVSNRDLEYVNSTGVMINLDSISTARRLAKLGNPEVSFRVNPEVGAGHHEHVITGGKESKFGIWEEDTVDAYKLALDKGLKPVGMHMHIGSGILEPEPFAKGIEKFMEIAGRVSSELGIDFKFLDLGGGIGVPYKPDDKVLDLQEFGKVAVGAFKEGVKRYSLREPTLILEPGRFLVCDSTVLLTNVNTVKRTPFKTFIGVDAGFNILLRPAMYGSYHEVVVANNMDGAKKELVTIAGPICESGDLLARDRTLPEIKEGDTLAVMNAGAYGFSMSSRYNSNPLPKEILIDGSRCAVIREAEDMDDILKHQKVAKWLK